MMMMYKWLRKIFYYYRWLMWRIIFKYFFQCVNNREKCIDVLSKECQKYQHLLYGPAFQGRRQPSPTTAGSKLVRWYYQRNIEDRNQMHKWRGNKSGKSETKSTVHAAGRSSWIWSIQQRWSESITLSVKYLSSTIPGDCATIPSLPAPESTTDRSELDFASCTKWIQSWLLNRNLGRYTASKATQNKFIFREPVVIYIHRFTILRVPVFTPTDKTLRQNNLFSRQVRWEIIG